MLQKNRKRIFWMPVLFAMAGIAVCYMFYQLWKISQEEKAVSIQYHAFGIRIPAGWAIHGIDVSVHQGAISWPAVKAMKIKNVQMGFVFIKATEGLKDKDKYFKQNWRKARKAGMTCGAYHFFLATRGGKEQAKHFINQVKLQKGDLPPVIDIENLYGVDPELMRSRVKEWLSVVETHYGIKPIIYSSAGFYEKHLGKEFEQYPLWVAHYLDQEAPRISRHWTFWQHSDVGRVNGITTNVDCNVFNGDSLHWRNLLFK